MALEMILEHAKRKGVIQKKLPLTTLVYNLAHRGEDSSSFQICAISSKVAKHGAYCLKKETLEHNSLSVFLGWSSLVTDIYSPVNLIYQGQKFSASWKRVNKC